MREMILVHLELRLEVARKCCYLLGKEKLRFDEKHLNIAYLLVTLKSVGSRRKKKGSSNRRPWKKKMLVRVLVLGEEQ